MKTSEELELLKATKVVVDSTIDLIMSTEIPAEGEAAGLSVVIIGHIISHMAEVSDEQDMYGAMCCLAGMAAALEFPEFAQRAINEGRKDENILLGNIAIQVGLETMAHMSSLETNNRNPN